MKHIIRSLCLVLISMSIISCRSISSAKGTCSISTISIPVGSTSPVMVYNARIDNDNWKLTVLNKDHQEKYKVEGEMFYSDKETGESWYSDKNVDQNQFEAMRDAFSLCRTLNKDNRVTKDFEKSRLYVAYRTSTLPKFIAMRKENNLRTTSSTTSFLQVQSEDVLDENLEKDLDELESDSPHDQMEEQYHNLNNEAYISNKELQDQLHSENESSNEIDNQIVLD
jgi:hypothetical protein